jgi:FkbM family methyltransferase
MHFERHETKVLGQELVVFDHPQSKAVDIISSEVNGGCYNFDLIDFRAGDTVLEIGAHVGIVAMTMAKKFGVQVVAFEAMPENANALEKNVAENGLDSHITVIPHAVTSDGRDITMIGNLPDNSGGATACLRDMYLPNHTRHEGIFSVAVNSIFTDYLPSGRIKLLKIDCEGSEHEIFQALLPENFHRIDHLRGELHINSHLQEQGYDTRQTYMRCCRYINPSNISLQGIRMAE